MTRIGISGGLKPRFGPLMRSRCRADTRTSSPSGEAERAAKSYGGNADRLIKAKRHYDPDNTFNSAIPLLARPARLGRSNSVWDGTGALGCDFASNNAVVRRHDHCLCTGPDTARSLTFSLCAGTPDGYLAHLRPAVDAQSRGTRTNLDELL